MNAPLVIDSFEGRVRSLRKMSSELPGHDRSEHVPDAGVPNRRDIQNERATGGKRQSEDRADDQPNSEYAERGGGRESGDADELKRLHAHASERLSRGCPVPFGHGAACLTIAEQPHGRAQHSEGELDADLPSVAPHHPAGSVNEE